jgi:hypothetical protein
VLVQGRASYDARPDRALLEDVIGPASERFMGAPKSGPFWDRWLSAYYADRVLVTVAVDRVTSWPDLACRGELSLSGAPRVSEEPASQPPPRNGSGPRVDVTRTLRRVGKLPHVLLGYRDADDWPTITPVRLAGSDAGGIRLEGDLPGGGRRAGLLAHRYEAHLIGLETRQYTGWLQDGSYAPHTESGFRAPANKTLLLLANGFMARRGLKRAQAAKTAAQPARSPSAS